jgi:hypothetical protein
MFDRSNQMSQLAMDIDGVDMNDDAVVNSRPGSISRGSPRRASNGRFEEEGGGKDTAIRVELKVIYTTYILYTYF